MYQLIGVLAVLDDRLEHKLDFGFQPSDVEDLYQVALAGETGRSATAGRRGRGKNASLGVVELVERALCGRVVEVESLLDVRLHGVGGVYVGQVQIGRE